MTTLIPAVPMQSKEGINNLFLYYLDLQFTAERPNLDKEHSLS
jgi:hypothetical protein